MKNGGVLGTSHTTIVSRGDSLLYAHGHALLRLLGTTERQPGANQAQSGKRDQARFDAGEGQLGAKHGGRSRSSRRSGRRCRSVRRGSGSGRRGGDCRSELAIACLSGAGGERGRGSEREAKKGKSGDTRTEHGDTLSERAKAGKPGHAVILGARSRRLNDVGRPERVS
jgi:hypothetical protein